MSTEEVLHALCQSGALKRFNPPLTDDESTYRRIYLHPDIHDWLYPAPGSPKAIVRYAADVRVYLKTFVTGSSFDDVEKLKNLDVDEYELPDEGVWAIRIKRRPQARIFGGFPTENIFVGTRVWDRGDLPPGEWVHEKDEVKTWWSGNLKITAGNPPAAYKLARLIGPSRAQLTSNLSPQND